MLDKIWAVGVKAPVIIGTTIFMGAVSVLTSFFDAEGRKQHAISKTWAKMLLVEAGITVRLRGLENVEPGENYVFVGNHLSLYDTPVVLANIPQQFLFLVAARYVKLPFLGTHLRRSGHFSVDQDDIRSSLKVMTEAAKRIQEKHLSVLLFPEGSRARAEMGEFKEGAAYIAIKSQVPVIPFALRGTREVLPVGSMHVRGLPVDFIIGKPIPTAGLTVKDRASLTETMRQRILELAAS
ncbi:MAG: lysophospholipid acyltransferase family protein [Bryobacteraceae bacterium]